MDNIEKNRYWQYQQDINNDFDLDTSICEVSELIYSVMKYKTQDIDRAGIFLSGGLDSRAVIAADKLGKITNVYSLGDSFNLECQIAEEVAKALNREYKYIQRDKNHYLNIYKESVEIGDGMYNYLHSHYLGLITQYIDKDIEVMFNGSLIEQLWQGSKFFTKSISIMGRKIKVPNLRKASYENIVESVLEEYPHQLKNCHLVFKNLTDSQVGEISKKTISSALNDNYVDQPYADQEAIDFLACDSFGRYSCQLNQISMNEEIMYRTILDNRLVDKLLEIPVKYRLHGYYLRKLIRHLNVDASEIKVAASNRKLKRGKYIHWISGLMLKLLRNLRSGNKIESKYTSWPIYRNLLIDSKDIQDIIIGNIKKMESMEPELFDYHVLATLLDEHIAGQSDYSMLLFQFMTFSQWYLTSFKEN